MWAAVALLAMLIELGIGYPQRLVSVVGHPVTWIGALIGWLDRLLNRGAAIPLRRAAGILAVVVVLALVGAIAWLAQWQLLRLPFGILIIAGLAGTMIAQRSLHRYVANVASALELQDLDTGRKAVSHIVGRDTAGLDKAINTADSMIGHRTPRYASFGWAAARLDDLVNLPASRLTALLLVAAAVLCKDASAGDAWRAVRRDAARHRSPNAGYPEAAIAGALGLALAGPRVYGGVPLNDAFMGDGRREANAKDIRRALALYRCADVIFLTLVAVLAALLIVLG